MRDIITRQEGRPYARRVPFTEASDDMQEELRDVFEAGLEMGYSTSERDGTVVEPVYMIRGGHESRGGFYNDGEWHRGTGTNLLVSRSSIPAFMRVLSDLLEHDPNEGEGEER
jgi:hypothetical protein